MFVVEKGVQVPSDNGVVPAEHETALVIRLRVVEFLADPANRVLEAHLFFF